MIRLKKADHIDQYTREKEFFDDEGFLQPGMITELDSFIKDATGADPAFRIYPGVFKFINGHKEAKSRLEKLNEIFPDGSSSKIFDELVRTRLYPYQKEG